MIFDILLDLTQQEGKNRRVMFSDGEHQCCDRFSQKNDDPDDPASLEDINSRSIPLSFTSSLMSKRFTSIVSLFQLSVGYPF